MTPNGENAIRRPGPGRCWVIVDPRLSADGPSAAVRSELANGVGSRAVWREAAGNRTGQQLAAAAVAARAARVVVVGDEVMLRGVASSLANTGVPLGMVPMGSGRGLARSIGAPTDPYAAVAAAVGTSRAVVDLMKVTIDGNGTTSSFISVGIEDVGSTAPEDSRGAGSADPLQGPRRPAVGVTATVDRQRPTYTRSAAWVIGIGSRVLSGDRAAADERLLHLTTLRAASRFGRHRAGDGPGRGVRRTVTPAAGPAGRRVLLVLDQARPYYLDGALAGQATTVSAELQPDALTVLGPG